ncbi:MAG: FG-GAP-like repeat-containing protein [Prochloraceae cyanobacterium]
MKFLSFEELNPLLDPLITTYGNIAVENIAYNVSPTDGVKQVVISNGINSLDTTALLPSLGINQNQIGNISGYQEGSALSIEVKVQARDKLSFDFNFLSNEGIGSYYNDFAFFSVANSTGSAIETRVLSDTFNLANNSASSLKNTSYQKGEYQFAAAGTYTVSFGVLDVNNRALNSFLLLDNVKIETLPVTIAGNVYNDLNANQRRDNVSEPGLQGWTVFIDGNNNKVLDTGEISTLTDVNGNYRFENLQQGTYNVAVKPSATEVDRWKSSSSPELIPSQSITVNAGQRSTPINFGFETFTLAGTGNFTNSGQTLGNLESNDVKLGDLDVDLDLYSFIANNLANQIYINDGKGNFTNSGQTLGNLESNGVELGDLDGDGDLDAFVANNGANLVYLNNGQGNFTNSGQTLGSLSTNDVELGDLDGDGDLDAFIANNGANLVYLNDGQGNFTNSGQALGSFISTDVELKDLDGDNDLDAFVANSEAGSGGSNRVYINDGLGNFSDSNQALRPLSEIATTSLTLDSPQGDFIGQGQFTYLTPADGTFNISRNFDNGVSLNFLSNTDFWSVDLAAPRDAILTPGAYEGAARFPFQELTQPGLNVSGNGRGSNRLSGRFDVFEAVYGPDGTVERFAADIVQRSEEFGPPLEVKVRYNASDTFDAPLSFGVDLADLDGNGTLDAFVANNEANTVWFNEPSLPI